MDGITLGVSLTSLVTSVGVLVKLAYARGAADEERKELKRDLTNLGEAHRALVKKHDELKEKTSANKETILDAVQKSFRELRKDLADDFAELKAGFVSVEAIPYYDKAIQVSEKHRDKLEGNIGELFGKVDDLERRKQDKIDCKIGHGV